MPGTMTLIAFPADVVWPIHTDFEELWLQGPFYLLLGLWSTASMIGSTPHFIVMIPAVVAAGIEWLLYWGIRQLQERRI